jgi:hypothetical protein
VTHCRAEEADQTVKGIERDIATFSGRALPPAEGGVTVHPRKSFGLGMIFASMLGKYRERSILALMLMVAQSFLYNSVFFSYGLILSHFYGVPEQHIGFYLLPLALGNFCGPLFLGTFFDTVGRRKMIAGTFAVSGLLLLVTALLFGAGHLSEITQTIAWLTIFFFASAAASSAYLTASEIFPAGDQSAGDCLLLRGGDRDRGKPLAASVRLADRVRIKLDGQYRICVGCAIASHRGADGMEVRYRRGGKVPGGYCEPAFQSGITPVLPRRRSSPLIV